MNTTRDLQHRIDALPRQAPSDREVRQSLEQRNRARNRRRRNTEWMAVAAAVVLVAGGVGVAAGVFTGRAWFAVPGRLAVAWFVPKSGSVAFDGTGHLPMPDITAPEPRAVGYVITASRDDMLAIYRPDTGSVQVEVSDRTMTLGGRIVTVDTAAPGDKDGLGSGSPPRRASRGNFPAVATSMCGRQSTARARSPHPPYDHAPDRSPSSSRR